MDREKVPEEALISIFYHDRFSRPHPLITITMLHPFPFAGSQSLTSLQPPPLPLPLSSNIQLNVLLPPTNQISRGRGEDLLMSSVHRLCSNGSIIAASRLIIAYLMSAVTSEERAERSLRVKRQQMVPLILSWLARASTVSWEIEVGCLTIIEILIMVDVVREEVVERGALLMITKALKSTHVSVVAHACLVLGVLADQPSESAVLSGGGGGVAVVTQLLRLMSEPQAQISTLAARVLCNISKHSNPHTISAAVSVACVNGNLIVNKLVELVNSPGHDAQGLAAETLANLIKSPELRRQLVALIAHNAQVVEHAKYDLKHRIDEVMKSKHSFVDSPENWTYSVEVLQSQYTSLEEIRCVYDCNDMKSDEPTRQVSLYGYQLWLRLIHLGRDDFAEFDENMELSMIRLIVNLCSDYRNCKDIYSVGLMQPVSKLLRSSGTIAVQTQACRAMYCWVSHLGVIDQSCMLRFVELATPPLTKWEFGVNHDDDSQTSDELQVLYWSSKVLAYTSKIAHFRTDILSSLRQPAPLFQSATISKQKIHFQQVKSFEHQSSEVLTRRGPLITLVCADFDATTTQ